jgi:hypothetical protein
MKIKVFMVMKALGNGKRKTVSFRRLGELLLAEVVIISTIVVMKKLRTQQTYIQVLISEEKVDM